MMAHYRAFTLISLLVSLLLSLAEIRPSDGRCASRWTRRRSAARRPFLGSYLSGPTSGRFECGQFAPRGNDRGLDYDERELDDDSGGYSSAGDKVQPNQYPSFVQIRLNFDIEPPACSGVLVSAWHVLTSAKCVGDFPQAEGFKQATAHLGAKRRSKSGKLIEPPVYDVDQICPFEKRSRAYDRRLVVLKLANRVKLSEHIQPACLPESKKKQVSMGRVATLVSIGASKIEGAIIAGHEPLRATLVKRVKCPNYLSTLGAGLCMRPEGHDGGTCDNDIGAPLIVERAERQYVVGLVSDHKAICTQEKETSAYADLTLFADEISQAMESCSSE